MIDTLLLDPVKRKKRARYAQHILSQHPSLGFRVRKGRPSRRARSLTAHRLTQDERTLVALLVITEDRPQTRADCQQGVNFERPCPWVGCKFHLYLDVNPETGSVKLNFPDLEPQDMKHSCALDVSDEGGTTLEEVGEMLNLTRERVRQIEVLGMKNLNRKLRANGISDPRLEDTWTAPSK